MHTYLPYLPHLLTYGILVKSGGAEPSWIRSTPMSNTVRAPTWTNSGFARRIVQHRIHTYLPYLQHLLTYGILTKSGEFLPDFSHQPCHQLLASQYESMLISHERSRSIGCILTYHTYLSYLPHLLTYGILAKSGGADPSRILSPVVSNIASESYEPILVSHTG